MVEPGQRTRDVYLPNGASWYDWWSSECFAGGETVTLTASWDRPPLLVREGSIIPLNVAEQHFAQPADARGFAIFPHTGEGTIEDAFFEDDGESTAYLSGQRGEWRVRVEADAKTLRLSVKATGTAKVPEGGLTVLLPRQEARDIQLASGRLLSDVPGGDWRTVRIAL